MFHRAGYVAKKTSLLLTRSTDYAGYQISCRQMSSIIQSLKKGISSLFGKKTVSEKDRVSHNLGMTERAGLGMLLYALIPLVKTVFGLAAKGLKDMEAEKDAILRQVCISLERDHRATELLGHDIRCTGIINSSSSAININGHHRAQYNLIVSVTGSKGSGIAEIVAGNGRRSQYQLEANTNVIWSGDSTAINTTTVQSCRLKTGSNTIDVEVDSVPNTIINI
jgi:hypothetical protein